MPLSWRLRLSTALRSTLVALALSASQLGCGSSPATTASSATSSSSSGGGTAGSGGTGGAAGSGGHGHAGAAGQGGTASPPLCVSSPKAAPFPGTDACPAPLPKTPDTFDAALAKGGLDRCHVRLLPADVALSGWPANMLVDAHRLPDFTPLQLGPLRLPGYARETRDWLDAAAASKNPVSETIAALSARRGHAIDHACVDLTAFAPAAGDATPLATAVLLLDQHQGGPGVEAAVRAAAAGVPLSLQRRLAPVLGAIDHAATEVKAALGTSDPAVLSYLAHSHALYVNPTVPFSTTAADLARLDKVDLGRMADAAALLAKAIEDADFTAEPAATFAPFEVATPLGEVVVHDAKPDYYARLGPAASAVLLFDLGGDDVYLVPAGASDEAHPVSVAIDVRGADQYRYQVIGDPQDQGLLPSDGTGRYASLAGPTMDDGPVTFSRVARQGAGVAGIGLLFDLGTEGDSYRSLAISQGFGATGVGVLYDAGGDDTYEAEVAAQGVAVYGLGALVDRSGNDTYRSFNVSQGFGGAEGAGALVDLAGDDTYFVDPGDAAQGGIPLYFSPQLPGTGNNSMSQGAAQGRRPQNAQDASFMAGGVGILRDKEGKDHYTGGVFAQGVGYWQGLGMLLEGGGDDVYDALWYIQGSTAHFALSIFLEEGGNDTYDLEVQTASTSIGVGHDFSASIHLDEGGDDRYAAPGLSLGSGNINGIGCLINIGGNDTYAAAGDPTFGAGNYSSEAMFSDPRKAAPTIGIFVDVGGTNEYTVGGVARPLAGTLWSYDPQPYPAPDMITTEHGCGADAPSGTVTLP